MINKAGCKIAEYAGDDHHTWQKQPEALLAHGVEPWRIGLQDHNDGHMPQIDPVLVPGYEVQRTQKPEIHFRQEGESHKQYTEQDRQDGMCPDNRRKQCHKARDCDNKRSIPGSVRCLQ